MKVMPDTAAVESLATSEEQMKELIGHAWDSVKRLTVQVMNHTFLLLGIFVALSAMNEGNHN